MNSSVASSWFYTRVLGEGVWLIAEPQHVCSYLVRGSDRAVLLDTGMGVLPIRPVAERLAGCPVDVVNTHYHFDHVGGNHEFERITIHEIGAPYITQRVPREMLDEYLLYADRQLAAAEQMRPLDREFTWVLGPESLPRPFPVEFRPDGWDYIPAAATDTVTDGSVIDLGDRTLRVIHAPGHSPDGICLLDEKHGFLFAGDSANAGPIYAHFPDSDLEALAASARRLAGLGDAFRVALFCHYGRPVAEPDLFDEIATGVERVRDGDVQLERAVDIIGTPMLEARFEHFSVTVVDPEAEAAQLVAGD